MNSAVQILAFAATLAMFIGFINGMGVDINGLPIGRGGVDHLGRRVNGGMGMGGGMGLDINGIPIRSGGGRGPMGSLSMLYPMLIDGSIDYSTYAMLTGGGGSAMLPWILHRND